MFRRIVGGAPEQRAQRFKRGQARFVQRKGFAGKERAEPAGACPTAAFRRETACRNSGRGRAGALGSSRAAEQTILRSVESSGAALEQRVQRFESGQARLVQRESFAGKESAEPAGACPTAAFRRETACRNSGRGRAGALGSSRAAEQTILRSVESSGAALEQRVQRFESGQARLVQRESFAGKESAEPAGACPTAVFRRETACRNSGRTTSFSTLNPVRRNSSSGRSSSGSRTPHFGQFCAAGRRFYVP